MIGEHNALGDIQRVGHSALAGKRLACRRCSSKLASRSQEELNEAPSCDSKKSQNKSQRKLAKENESGPKCPSHSNLVLSRGKRAGRSGDVEERRSANWNYREV